MLALNVKYAHLLVDSEVQLWICALNCVALILQLKMTFFIGYIKGSGYVDIINIQSVEG